ncbi:ABC transporter permease [Actinoplanes sp. NPDC049548]|uniref:ABC transporter permease n=1 Tax=Actinoplanes sp. NPDC049548 TaxID=3155152 RepID=UPI003438C2B6
MSTPRRLSLADVLHLGAVGLRTRPLRVMLSASGIAIGIAAMLAVVGISASGRADLQRTLDRLGTNLLVVSGGDEAQGDSVALPAAAVPMIERIGPVLSAAAVSRLPDDVHVYRNDRIPAERSAGITAYATDLDLPAVVGARMTAGAWLNPAMAAYPAVVLGADAAHRLGIRTVDTRVLVHIGGRRFAVVGILARTPLVSALDSAALIGTAAARRYLAAAGSPTTVFLRAAYDRVPAVRDVLAATADPATPYRVVVSRPSDALAAKLATERTLNGLLLGVGAVALLVGGVGVANTMVISVLERRTEIGLRRSLGATRGQIRLQFCTESVLLTTLGGAGGLALGMVATAGYALSRGWPTATPGWAFAAGLGATVAVGAVAGLYPAVRAARMTPAEALAEV